MYSNLDLITIIVISLGYIGLFKLQKHLTPLKYFSNADLVIQESVSYLQMIIRYVLIAIFSITLQVIFRVDNNLILLGNLLGAFLIVWPTLYSPQSSYDTYISKENKVLIYLLHIVFVITTGGATYLSLMFIPLYANSVIDYLCNILFPGAGLAFGEYIKRKLSNKIILTKEKDEEEYENIIEED